MKARASGILAVNKPVGMTSHDVVKAIRRLVPQVKIGHTGTLDPAATGLLLLCLGRATLLSRFLSDWDKRYRAELTLGAVSDTMDRDGTITPGGTVPDLLRNQLEEILRRFQGEITLSVPLFSAVRKDGKKLYEYARKGKSVDTPARAVTIHDLQLLAWNKPRLEISVHCSKGTYIRALAGVIGEEIGCGAYLSALERTAVGPYSVDRAWSIEQVAATVEDGKLSELLVPMNEILQFPLIYLPDDAAHEVRHGACPTAEDVANWQGRFKAGDLVCFVTTEGNLLAVGRSHCDSEELPEAHDKKVFSFERVVA